MNKDSLNEITLAKILPNKNFSVLLLLLLFLAAATGCMPVKDSEDTVDQAIVNSSGDSVTSSLGARALQIKVMKCSRPDTNRLSPPPAPASNAKLYILLSSTEDRECLPISKLAESVTSSDGTASFSLSDPSLKYTILIDLDQDGLPDDRVFDVSPLDSVETISYSNSGTSSKWADLKILPKTVDHGGLMKIELRGYSEESCQADVSIYNQITGTELWRSQICTLGETFKKLFFFEIPLTWPSSSSTAVYTACVNISDSNSQRILFSGDSFTVSGTLSGTAEPSGNTEIELNPSSIEDETPFTADITISSSQPYHKFADLSVKSDFSEYIRTELIWSDEYIAALKNIESGSNTSVQNFPALSRTIQVQLTPEEGAKRVYARFADTKGIFSSTCHTDFNLSLTPETSSGNINLTGESQFTPEAQLSQEAQLTQETDILNDGDPLIELSLLEINSTTGIMTFAWTKTACPDSSFMFLYLIDKNILLNNDETLSISDLPADQIISSELRFGPFAPTADSGVIDIDQLNEGSYLPVIVLNTSGEKGTIIFRSFSSDFEFTHKVSEPLPQPTTPDTAEPEPYATAIKTLTPENNKQNAPKTGLLTWQTTDINGNVLDDSQMTFTLFMDTDSEPDVVFADNIKSTSFAYSGLEHDQTWYWYVESENSQGQVLKSSISSFTVPAFPVLTLTSPQNNSIISGKQDISWSLSGPAPEDALVTISFSINNGAWITLVTNISAQSPYEMDTTRLGSDNRYKFRVIIKTNDFYSMDENSEFVEIKQ